MTTPKPPAKSAGWFERLLELGNHNKIIAAATLITIATGAPYLVMSAVRLFAAEEDASTGQVVTRAMLEEALAASALRVQADEDLAAAKGGGVGPEGVAAASEALATLGEEATRAEATEEERRRVLEAYEQHAMGKPALALAEFERIAMEQEERGADELAARNWRRRGALQVHSDASGALEDYIRAERLHPGEAGDELVYARLLIDQHYTRDAVDAVRRAIRKAREADDLEVLGRALLEFARGGALAMEIDRNGSEELLAARWEAEDIFRELMLTEPERLEFVTDWAVVANELRAAGEFPADEVSERVRAEIDRVAGMPHGGVREAERHAVLAHLRSVLVGAEYAQDAGVEALDPLIRACTDDIRRALDARSVTVSDLGTLQSATFGLSVVIQFLDLPGRRKEVNALGLEAARAEAAVVGESPGVARMLTLAHFTYSDELRAAGDVDGALEELATMVQVAKDAVPAYRDARFGWADVAQTLFLAGTGAAMMEGADAQALAWFDECQELARTWELRSPLYDEMVPARRAEVAARMGATEARQEEEER